MSYEIDCEAATSGYEFLAGAGLSGLNGDKHDEIVKLMQQNGVQMVYGPEGVQQIDSRRVCLLNTETDMCGTWATPSTPWPTVSHSPSLPRLASHILKNTRPTASS